MQSNTKMEDMNTKPIKKRFDWTDVDFINNYRERLNKSLTASKFTHLSHTSIAKECKAKLDKIINDYNCDDPNVLPVSSIEFKIIIREKIKALNNNKAIGMSRIIYVSNKQ